MSENETGKREFVRALVDRSPEAVAEPPSLRNHVPAEGASVAPAADSDHERRRLVAQLLDQDPN